MILPAGLEGITKLQTDYGLYGAPANCDGQRRAFGSNSEPVEPLSGNFELLLL